MATRLFFLFLLWRKECEQGEKKWTRVQNKAITPIQMIHQKSTHITRETNWKVGLESIYQENWKKSKSQIFPFDCGYLTWVKWTSVVTLVPLFVDINRHTSICTAFPHHLQTIRQRTDIHTLPSKDCRHSFSSTAVKTLRLPIQQLLESQYLKKKQNMNRLLIRHLWTTHMFLCRFDLNSSCHVFFPLFSLVHIIHPFSV